MSHWKSGQVVHLVDDDGLICNSFILYLTDYQITREYSKATCKNCLKVKRKTPTNTEEELRILQQFVEFNFKGMQ